MTNLPLDSSVNIVSDTTELVRGQEQQFLERLRPLVKSQSVRLDLSSVERIDAAGIAALITLYSTARQANREFTISKARQRVREILRLVGVEQMLASRNVKDSSHSDSPVELTAV